jgi:hypothetical protein
LGAVAVSPMKPRLSGSRSQRSVGILDRIDQNARRTAGVQTLGINAIDLEIADAAADLRDILGVPLEQSGEIQAVFIECPLALLVGVQHRLKVG